MRLNLPENLESPLMAAVQCGHFASVDDAMAEAVRLLLRKIVQPQASPNPTAHAGLGFIGALRDDAELLDQADEHAMTVREQRPWRLDTGE